MDYEQLRDIYQKEIDSNGTSYVSESFYDELKEYLNELKEDLSDLLREREYKNSKKMVEDIIRIRLEKIAMASIRGIELTGLSREEQEFHQELLEKAQKIKSILKEKDKKEGIKKIKVIKEIRAYRGVDGNIYGPYAPGEVIELPEEEVKWLLEKGYVEVE